ncbi:MAG: DUF3015 family protein [Betaproteobacteria bacterium]|nr:DUF3015 family protein [Betaproteobacteria bacterium]MBL8534371.1 DUF3015 family protein [Betaproteobacteria bacterium]
MSFGRAAVAAALVAAPLMSHAAGDNVGACGPGSRLFEGQSGIAPQVLAVTTNQFAGINTFAMSSGTSGCSQDGKVSSNWKTAQFIDGNKDRLARDLSRGSGESLDSLAQLLGVTEQDKAAFVRTARDNMARIFPSARASTEEIRTGLRAVLAADASLAAYAARV